MNFRSLQTQVGMTGYVCPCVYAYTSTTSSVCNHNLTISNSAISTWWYYIFLELADLTCTIVSHLLNRSTRLDYGKEWSRIIALQSDYSTVSTAFMKALSTHIDDLIVPLFGGILAIIDTNDNLDLAFSKQQCTRFAWKLIYQDESILPWNSLISERSLRSPKSLLNHSKECLLKNNKFPFFKIIYQQVNCIYTDMVMNLGRYQNVATINHHKHGWWMRYEIPFYRT